jgi:ubiquinone/menaquinone biosynthesis C-methylase UbiE
LKNPWLDIPLADYEGHMALPDVEQTRLLSDIFAGALHTFAPRSVAVLGCAGGNGFDRVAGTVTDRVVGVDINPDYIRQARRRYEDRIPRLELIVADVERDACVFAPVDLVFAGLLFEYVDADAVLGRIRAMLSPGGTLVTVVQLPSAAIPEITPSPFASLGALSPVMHLVAPETLTKFAAARGFREIMANCVRAAGGKEFRVQEFHMGSPPAPAR